MLAYNMNSDLLRKDLMNYYGTAAFNGFPCAIMDVFAVERMNSEQLMTQAQKNGFAMDRYLSSTLYSTSSLTTKDLVPFSNQGRRSYTPNYIDNTGSKQEELSIPLYGETVNAAYYALTEEAHNIIKTKMPQWEKRLFAQELLDFSYQLGKLKKQAVDNPYVKAIGNTSEGRPLLYYIVGFTNNCSLAVDEAEKGIEASISSLERFFSERQDETTIRNKAIAFMRPFQSFLALYNDISLIEMPEKYRVIYSELRKALKSLMSDCEMFYYELAKELNDSVDRKVSFSNNVSLKLHGFYTKKISEAVIDNIKDLMQYQVQRKTI